MIKKYKDYSLKIGLIFTVASAVFSFVMTWLIYADAATIGRIADNLYDCGVDTIGTFICAALFYGTMKQDGEGTMEFRSLNVMVSANFVLNFLMYYTVRIPEYNGFTFTFILLNKLLDLGIIYYFYQYVKKTLGFEGRLARWADKLIPVLLVFENLVVLSNIIGPTTFFVNDSGSYQNTGVPLAEDVFLIVTSLLTTILIIRSESPRSQKIAALTFIFLPLIIFLTTMGEYGNASQYGMTLMSLVIMYCIIFNYNSGKLQATQTELNMATEIQASMLPSIFPAFPNREEFDLYASMDPAKEVGGDFYDFFMVDEDHLGIVIADVSGKGVPAALFMMISKTVVQNFAMLGFGAAETLNKANEALCAQNKMQMFVTTWIGILELSTGKMTCASAGHEYPAVYHEGKFELLKDKHGLVLGGMDGARYKEYDIRLDKGDKIFVYTDGVPEATSANTELFGTDRMIDALNKNAEAIPYDILKNVRAAVDDFVGAAEQFDDLTMLCLEYRGRKEKQQHD